MLRARALNAIVAEDYSIVNDDCSPCGSYKRAINGNTELLTKQQYSLFPNPNDGKLSIEQAITDNRAVCAEIYDAIGSCVHKQNLDFAGRFSNLQLHQLASGVYVLNLTNADGKVFHLKFVVK